MKTMKITEVHACEDKFYAPKLKWRPKNDVLGTEHGDIDHLEWSKIEINRLDRIVFVVQKVTKGKPKYVNHYNTKRDASVWIKFDAPGLPEEYNIIKREIKHKLVFGEKKRTDAKSQKTVYIEGKLGKVVK